MNNRGINEDAVNKLILDIYNYEEKINKTLDQISTVVENTKEFYQCESANEYRNKFNMFSANFNIINKNLLSYADDMIKLKNRYKVIDSNVANIATKAAVNMESTNNKW